MDDTMEMWIYATASVILISVAPAIVLIFIPINHKEENKFHLQKLLAVAAGCLLGDAFLHLIPHSRADDHDDHHHHRHNHGHDYSHDDHHHEDYGHSHHHDMSGLKILCGMMVFLIMEKFIYAMKSNSGCGHSHSSSNKNNKNKERDVKEKKKNDDYRRTSGINVTGWLNLAADFLHNFTDGLAIGASFLVGKQSGIQTSLAIFLHEVPHEIGDYAILVQSGCSKTKAIWLQLLTAIGACTGTVISLLIGTLGGAKSWILPFTAGGFIYIATVHILPQLKNGNFKQTLSELFCIVGGVGLMYIMASFE